MKISRAQFQPTREILEEIHLAFKELSYSPSLKQWVEQYYSEHRMRLAVDLEVISQRAPDNSKILEIGCSPYILTTALIRAGFNITGIDLNPEYFQETIEKVGIRVKKCDVEKDSLPFGEEEFDIVIFNEIFEHLRINPIFTIGEIHRVTKLSGTLFLSTPNLRSFEGISNLLFKSSGYALCGEIFDEYQKQHNEGFVGHVREYAPGDVINYLENGGFKTSELLFRGVNFNSICNYLLRWFPQFSPFVTYVGQKTNNNVSVK